VTCSLKNLWRISGVLCRNHTQTYLYDPFSLSASVRFHLPLWAGVHIRWGERETVTSGPLFSETGGHPLRVSYLVSAWCCFWSWTKFILKWPKELSQFSHNVRKDRLVAGLLNYFKRGSSCKCQKFSRSVHSHNIMQMWHFLDFSNKKRNIRI